MPDYITTRSGLIVPTAAFEEAATERPELREIASIDRDWKKTFFGQVLQNDDDTLLTRGGGKGLRIYDELERDAHAYAELQKRKLAVVARPWDVAAASEDAADVEVADMVREVLKGIQFDRICVDLLDATLKGFSVGEVMWKLHESQDHGHLVVPGDVIARSQLRFTFGKTRDPESGEHPLRLLTQSQMIEGEELPPRKFIVHRFGAKDGSPYGLGLGNRLFWPVFFKRQGIGFWLVFADKFGSPTAIGKYPRGALEPEQKKLLGALRAISNDVGIVVPDDTLVELLEAGAKSSTDTYEKLARYMDEQISKSTVGGTMSSTAHADGLGGGQAQVHDGGRKEISQADSDLLSDTLNNTLVKWLVEFNRPGVKKLPKVWRSFDEQEDLNKRAERDQKISQLGYEPEESYILDTYGPGWKKKAAPPPPAPGANPAPNGADPAHFAEPATQQRSGHRAAQDALALGAEALAGNWQRLMNQRVEDLVALAEESGDLATFRSRLAELLDSEPPAEVVEAIARAGFTSQLLGRGKEVALDTEPAKGVIAAFAERVLDLIRPRAQPPAAAQPQPLHLHFAVDARQGPVTKQIVLKREDGTEVRAESRESTQ